MKNYITIAIAALTLASCGEGSTEQKQEPMTPEVADETCTYTYNNESTEVRWTAYKHTAKNPVGGQFDVFSAEGGTEATTVEDALKGLSITIDPASVNSKDPIRDGKLISFFFGNMADTAAIFGKIESMEDGKGFLTMDMNNNEILVEYAYSLVENKVELKTTIDILQFGADDAFSALGEACTEKHTGGDGEVKFWSEVSIYITTELVKNCE